MPADNNQLAPLLRVKAEYLQMAATPGWQHLLRSAEIVIADLEKKAVQEDSREKRDELIHDARGARKFLDGILRCVETARNISAAPQDDDADEFYAVIEKRPEAFQ